MRYPISLGADAVTIGIDESSDLEVWQDAAPNFELVDVQNFGDGRALVTARLDLPIGGGDEHFVRLRVEMR